MKTKQGKYNGWRGGPWWDLEDAAIWVLWLRGKSFSEIAEIVGCKEYQPKRTITAWVMAGGNPRDGEGKIAVWWKKELARPTRNAMWRKRFERMTQGEEQ
jgi:hypothetical protein